MRLQRFAYTPHGTFGKLFVGGWSCYTIERPWLLNQPNVSCIPEGVYKVAPRRFNRGDYDAMEVQDVPGRSYILFHVGNTMDDLQGCIAPGTNLGHIRGKWGVTASRSAFDAFMAEAREETEVDIYFRGLA